MDVKASRVDNLVTIVVNETFSAVATAMLRRPATPARKVRVQRPEDHKGHWAFGNLLNANTQTALQGQGETSRGAVLTANLSARVAHVLPNGYLVVEGTKRVQVSSENQVVTVRGVIRQPGHNQYHFVQPHRANGVLGEWQGRGERSIPAELFVSLAIGNTPF